VTTSWRIVTEKYAGSAFDGEAARLAGGRWNSPGAAVVYTANSAALAALEMLVHLRRTASLPAYGLIGCSFEESLVTTLERSRLPANWRSYPAPPELQLLGDEWIRAGDSPVLEVPSAVVPTESNYLLNPQHRAFARIRASRSQPFDFDLRLLAV
jgi:RES domain-containing protein